MEGVTGSLILVKTDIVFYRYDRTNTTSTPLMKVAVRLVSISLPVRNQLRACVPETDLNFLKTLHSLWSVAASAFRTQTNANHSLPWTWPSTEGDWETSEWWTSRKSIILAQKWHIIWRALHARDKNGCSTTVYIYGSYPEVYCPIRYRCKHRCLLIQLIRRYVRVRKT